MYKCQTKVSFQLSEQTSFDFFWCLGWRKGFCGTGFWYRVLTFDKECWKKAPLSRSVCKRFIENFVISTKFDSLFHSGLSVMAVKKDCNLYNEVLKLIDLKVQIFLERPKKVLFSVFFRSGTRSKSCRTATDISYVVEKSLVVEFVVQIGSGFESYM